MLLLNNKDYLHNDKCKNGGFYNIKMYFLNFIFLINKLLIKLVVKL